MELTQGPNFNLPEILVFLLQNMKGDLHNVLVELSHPVLFSAINKFYLEGYEKEDLLQEGRLILTRAIEEYDFESTLEFFEYYQMMLMNHLHKLLRKQEAQIRKANKGAYSLDELTENLGIQIQGYSAVETNPENAYLLKEGYEQYIQGLSNREFFIYSEFIKGKTLDEMVKSTKCKKTQVRSTLYRCKTKLDNSMQ